MATANGSWVVASSKKKTQTVSPSSKAKKKSFVEGMPRIEPKVPVEETPTIYSVFAQEEERKERKAEREQLAGKTSITNVGISASNASKKSSQSTKKPAGPEKKKEKPIALEEALKEVSITELQAVLAKDKVTFPDNPDVWLKDLVSLLNLRLDKLPSTDSLFADKPADYPCCLLSKSLRTFLLDTLSKMTPQALNNFLEHCVDSMMNDTAKGIPIYGFLIYIQLLLINKPQIGIANLGTYLQRLKDNVNRPQRALCILWALGQAGLNDLMNGLRVWFELMLPVLNMRSLSSFAVHYLETLFRRHPNIPATASASFPKREFFKLFDELFSPQSALSPELRSRLMRVYPQLKAVAYGSSPETTLHNYFSSFLSRCTTDCHGTKRTELLSCLVTCLLVDKQSFSIWRQIYVKNLAQSSVLMQHLTDNLEGSVAHVDRRLLRETVRAFHVTNEDLASSSTANMPSDLKLCVSTCQDLLNHLSRRSAHWFTTIAVFIMIVLLMFSVDVYMSGGIADSKTYRALDGLGVTSIMLQAWQRLCLYTGKAWLWLRETTPVYWSKAEAIVLPYVTLVYQRLVNLVKILSELLQPVVQQLCSYIQQFVVWINSKLPWVLEMLGNYCTIVLNLVYSLYEYIHVCNDWILKNILVGSWSPDNILRVFSDLLVCVKSSSNTFYQWIVSNFA